MRSADWIALIKKLPPEAHNQLVVTTVGKTEVIVQSFLMLEGECLVLKGRLAASQDTGRLFFVPYDQIDTIAFLRAVPEEEFRTWFDEPSVPATEAVPVETNGSDKGNGSNGSNPRTQAPNRAALLERVRARTTMGGTSLTPANGTSLPTPPPASF